MLVIGVNGSKVSDWLLMLKKWIQGTDSVDTLLQICEQLLGIISNFHVRFLSKFFITPENMGKPIWYQYNFPTISWWIEVD